MNSQNDGVVIGIPVVSVSYAAEEFQDEPETLPETHILCDECNQDKKDSVNNWITKLRLKARYHVHNMKDRRSQISQTVKGKLTSGTSVLRSNKAEKDFRTILSVVEGERLIEYSKCFLSTTAGPIAGVLYISTEKIAFLSDRSLKLTSPTREFAKFRYKVMIPLAKIKTANPIEDYGMPNNYVRVVTVDEFDFWFMGFVKYQKFFDIFQQTLSREQSDL